MTVRPERDRIGVLHMTDTLDPGGTERVAVNLVNALPRDRFSLALCATRRSGALSELVAPDVARLDLGRRRTFDAGAVWRLRAFIASNNIRIIHAHSSSLFVAIAGSFGPPYPAVIWHDHCGFEATAPRPVPVYRTAALRVGGVISVSEFLAEWARTKLRVPPERVWYIPNFVSEPTDKGPAPMLPGRPEGRIVCVANLRPQKDHLGLLRALAIVVQEIPHAHLLLVGREAEASHARAIQDAVQELGLADHVTAMGERNDVAAILNQCAVGVLSSLSEGFPLALAEYGLAGLGVVTTDVGQCGEVVDSGRAGLVVPARDPVGLAAAISQLLRSAERRRELGALLRTRVRERYGADSVVQQVAQVYDTVTEQRQPGAWSFHWKRHA